MDMSWVSFVLEKFGLPLGMIVIALILGSKEKPGWVFGRELRNAEEREKKCQTDYEKRLADAQRREDEWREIALNGGYLARQAVDLARRQSPSGR